MSTTYLIRRHTVLAYLFVALAFASVGWAQESAGQPHLEQARILVAAGDTAGAIRELKTAIDVDKKLFEAHLELGRIYTRLASWKETDPGMRRKAEKELDEALRLGPDDPRVLAALGELRIKQHMKLDGGRILSRALAKATEQDPVDSALVAEIAYNLGYVTEREYDRMRNRYFIPPTRGPISTDITNMGSSWLNRGVDEYLRSTAPVVGMGSSTRDKMLAHYYETLRYDVTHFEAHRRLMLYLYDGSQIDEYMLLATNLAESHPDQPVVHLYEGLGLHAAGLEDEAGQAFDRAFATMSEDERWIFRNLEPTLRADPGKAYMSLEDDQKAQFEDAYWRVTDPLFMTEANERRLEHLSRVAYADLRFHEPATGKRGWETDRGTIYIRYGAPMTMFRQAGGQSSRQTIVWRYGDGPTFMFSQTTGYNRALFAGDYRFIAQDYRFVQPANYDRIPSIPEMLDLPTQLARFRGANTQELAVEVHAELPIPRLARSANLDEGEIEGGFFVVNALGRRVVSQPFSEIVDYATAEETDNLRSWRLILPGGGLLVAAVEARETSSWVSAASRDTFTAALFHNDGSPKISDILLADFVRELRPEPKRRGDYDIIANPSREYLSGDALHIYYEAYDLTQDDQGFASFDVAIEVRIERLHREGGIAQILGGLADAWGFTVEGDDQLGLRFSREVDMNGRDRVTEYLGLELKDAPAGDYEIRVRIWDKLAEEMAERGREFVVISNE